MKSAAQRKRDERERKAKQGIQRLELWLHPCDVPRVKAYAERLVKKRAKS